MMPSQKVIVSPSGRRRLCSLITRNRTENGEFWLQTLAQLHNTRDVSAAVAVVWCTPDGDDIIVVEVVLVALVYKLVGSGDEC